MERKIEDYLYLYLGCEAIFDNKRWKLFRIDNKIARLTRPREGRSYGSWVECNIKDCFPLLRPLSDMTEEDVSEWSDVTVTNTPYCVELDSKDEFGEFTTVYPDGSILSKSKDDGDIRPINGGHLFRLLLSKHFDLFGLIEAGLAINSTTTKKTSKR